VTDINKYDQYFKVYAAIYFGGKVSWHWFKAMGIAESCLNPKAVSPVGAQGIMQLMPATREEVGLELGLINYDPWNPKINILMGIHYAKKQWNIFKKEEGLERLCFMFGAYNAGARNIIRAQKIATKPDIWTEIAAVMPQVTGDHALETVGYLSRSTVKIMGVISGGIWDLRQRVILSVLIKTAANMASSRIKRFRWGTAINNYLQKQGRQKIRL